MEAQKSQKGADDIIMKRKIYQQLLDWKEKRNGEVALLVEGARRIGKSYIVEEFAKNEYESYILIDPCGKRADNKMPCHVVFHYICIDK